MGVIIMLFFLSIMVAATSPITAKFPFNFPRPQVLALPTFPWVPMPFVGGPNSLPPWLRPQVSEDKPGMEEFPIEEQEMIVGGPDSLPPWLRPQIETSENKEEMIVGGPDSLPPWLRPQTETSENDEEMIVGGPDFLPPWLKPQTETSENEEEGGPDSLPPWLRPPVQGSESVPASRFIDNTGAAKDTLEEEGKKKMLPKKKDMAMDTTTMESHLSALVLSSSQVTILDTALHTMLGTLHTLTLGMLGGMQELEEMLGLGMLGMEGMLGMLILGGILAMSAIQQILDILIIPVND